MKSDDISELILIPIFFIILFALTVAQAADSLAQNTASISQIQTQTSAKQDNATDVKEEKKITLSTAYEYSSNLQDRNDPDADTSSSIIIAPVYKINEKSAIDARLDIIQNHNGDERTDLSNLIVVGTPYTFQISKNLNFQPKIGAAAPTSEKSRDDETYLGGASLRPTFTLTIPQIKGLTIANTTYFTKSFHEKEFKRDGSQNTEYSIRNRVRILYQITEKLYLDSLNDYVRGQTYSGFERESFLLSQEIGYEVIPTWTVYINHVNEGSARGPNNSGDNVDVFNERSSKFGIGFSKVL